RIQSSRNDAYLTQNTHPTPPFLLTIAYHTFVANATKIDGKKETGTKVLASQLFLNCRARRSG
ncbi:hypothetical protein, partial [Streptococcus sp.]|uniref:hypothetical protein n=1 Tax=Streptococcus sp. TaxID=1306 RepID=UPI003AA937E9